MENTLKSMYRYLNTLLYFALIIVFSAFGSCNSDDAANGQLARAGSLLDSNPEQALCILDSVNIDSIHNDKMIADYALLLTAARYKSFINETNDSVILTAVNYFAKSNDEFNLMKALYYCSNINKFKEEYNYALKIALEAERIAKAHGDKLWIAKTNELVADILFECYEWKESLKYREVAINNYKEAGKKANYHYALLDKATSYSNWGKYRESAVLMDSILAIAASDSVLMAETLKKLIPSIVYTSDYERAEKIIYQFNTYQKFIDKDNQYYADYAELYRFLGDYEKADKYIDSAVIKAKKPVDKLRAYNARRNLLVTEMHVEHDFVACFDSINKNQKIIMKQLAAQSLISSQGDFLNDEIIAAKLKTTKLIYFSIFIIGLLLLLIIYFKLRIYRSNVEIKEKIVDIMMLKDKLSIQSDKIDGMLQNRFETINLLCEEYSKAIDNYDVKDRVIEKFRTEINKFASPEIVKCLGENIDENMDGILSRVKDNVPKLTDKDTQLLVYILLGFSSKTICVLSKLNYQTYYSRKRRLIKKISESDLDCKDDVINRIN